MYPTVVQADDNELRKRILILLQSRGVSCSAEPGIQVTGGVVSWSGKFASSSDRRLALECCRHMAGVLRIDDRTIADGDCDCYAEAESGGDRIGGYASYADA
jgi:osmotically-inducible protein OsmY